MKRFWKFLCSLKLAIVLASAATMVAIAGSLTIPFNPQVFGSLDSMAMGDWITVQGLRAWGRTWWIIPLAGLLAALAVNTLCCFTDWIVHFRARWRKSGEYLIHLGFVLVVIAYTWGAAAGSRSEGNMLRVGDSISVPGMPGYSLHLDRFEPVMGKNGRPLDMLNTLGLFNGNERIATGTARTNHPLLYKGLAVIGSSFGRVAEGFEFTTAEHQSLILEPGRVLPLHKGRLRVLRFYPDAARQAGRRTVQTGWRLRNPALQLELQQEGMSLWRGWYHLREQPPAPLLSAGLDLRPKAPVFGYYSVLTINRDPGAGLALTGGIAMIIGVLFALFSFYYKRTHSDRPQIT